eukprot:symbB.v1.2.000933.t1/scaffold54.1/size375170/6
MPSEPMSPEEEVWKSKKRFYKQTRLCSFHQVGACKRGSACNFAHDSGELKEMPDFSKTRLCKTFQTTGRCELGDSCTFAHGHHELIVGKKGKQRAARLSSEVFSQCRKPGLVVNEGRKTFGSHSISDEEVEAMTGTPSQSVSGSSNDWLEDAFLFEKIPDLWQRSRFDLAGHLIISV